MTNNKSPYENEKYLRDKDGKRMRTADGSLMPYSHFENEPSDSAYEYVNSEAGQRDTLERMLRMGLKPSDQDYLDAGYYKKDGKWIPDDPDCFSYQTGTTTKLNLENA